MLTDPYLHLPHLRGRIMPAEECSLRMMCDADLHEWDERARAMGRPPDWRMANDAREANRRAVLATRDAAEDLWVYAYGSLMWNPGIHFSEVRLAELDHHQRRFTYRLHMGRGTPECPGLVLALEKQPGTCQGLAFRVPAAHADRESAVLWRREMLRGGYVPQLLSMRTPQGEIEAVVFGANHDHADHHPELPVAQTAAIIASACGTLGSNREYLEQLAGQLAALRIEDPYISELMRHVQGVAAPA